MIDAIDEPQQALAREQAVEPRNDDVREAHHEHQPAPVEQRDRDGAGHRIRGHDRGIRRYFKQRLREDSQLVRVGRGVAGSGRGRPRRLYQGDDASRAPHEEGQQLLVKAGVFYHILTEEEYFLFS
jgi:hypothetical protein